MHNNDFMIIRLGEDNKPWILKFKYIDQPYVIDYDDFSINLSIQEFDSNIILTNFFKAFFKLIDKCDCGGCNCNTSEKYAKTASILFICNPNFINDFHRTLNNYYESQLDIDEE
jgi:hypothetical protein